LDRPYRDPEVAMRGVTVRTAAWLVAFGALTLVPLPGHVAVAGCEPGFGFAGQPNRHRVALGETVTLTGGGFTVGCDDNGDPEFACATPDSEKANKDVALVLRRGDTETTLATVDARHEGDDYGSISWTVTIPVDAAASRQR